MLVLSRKKEESILIGDNVRVTVLEIQGERVRLGIVAPAEVPVHREEILRRIAASNRDTQPLGADCHPAERRRRYGSPAQC